MVISVSTDKGKLDVGVIHRYLSEESYWAKGIARERVERAIAHSLCFGVYDGEEQVGFARVISDYTTFAYIADVFIVRSHRRRGLSKMLMQAIREHPELQGLRRWSLVTQDAHGLYRQFGFTSVARPERYMEIVRS